MKALRLLGPAGFLAVALAACAGSNAERNEGVTSMQAPNQCLQLRAACANDDDCCSMWCANGVCTHKEP